MSATDPKPDSSALSATSDSEAPANSGIDKALTTPVPESPPVAPDTTDNPPASPTVPSRGALVTTRPRHPMPTHFPEVHLPEIARPAPPRPVPSVPSTPPPDPHSVQDGAGYVPERLVCIRCGSTNLARGQVVDYGDKFRDLRFAPKRMTLSRLNSLLNLRPFRTLVKVNALACRDCGLVQMVIDPGDLRRVEHHRD
jgi:hypothetical protein